MVAKRGEDKKWDYKIFNVQVKAEDSVDLLRINTFLKNIARNDAEDLLKQLHEEFDRSPNNKIGIYNTNTKEDEGDKVVWDILTEESSGSFELPELGSVVQIFDIKRQKHDHHTNTTFIHHA
jgi:hypothetical protein